MRAGLSFFCLAMFLLSGCATILNEEYQKINVTTTNNKTVNGTVDGMPFTAPGIVSVKRTKEDKILMVNQAGCTKQTLLASKVDEKFFINILTGGVFGSTTDYASEKMWKYQELAAITCN